MYIFMNIGTTKRVLDGVMSRGISVAGMARRKSICTTAFRHRGLKRRGTFIAKYGDASPYYLGKPRISNSTGIFYACIKITTYPFCFRCLENAGVIKSEHRFFAGNNFY